MEVVKAGFLRKLSGDPTDTDLLAVHNFLMQQLTPGLAGGARRRALGENLADARPTDQDIDWDVSKHELKKNDLDVSNRGYDGKDRWTEPDECRGCTPPFSVVPVPYTFLPALPGQWYVVGVVGDGACLFHAFSWAVDVVMERRDGTSVSYRSAWLAKDTTTCHEVAGRVRCAATRNLTPEAWAAAMREERLFAPGNQMVAANTAAAAARPVEEIKEEFCTVSNWATDVLILWLRRIMQLNILFVNVLTGHTMFCGIHGAGSAEDHLRMPLIVLAWEEKSHFAVLAYAGGLGLPSGSEFSLRCAFFPGESAEDRRIVEAVMAMYDNQCECNAGGRPCPVTP